MPDTTNPFIVDEPRTWGHTAPERPETGHYIIIWAYTYEEDETDKIAQITAIRDNPDDRGETVISSPIYPIDAKRKITVNLDELSYLGMNRVNRTHTWAYTPE